MIPDLTHKAFVDTRQSASGAGLPPTRSAAPAPVLQVPTTPGFTQRLPLSQLLRRFVVWAVGSVVLGLALDVAVRHYLPRPDFRLDLLIIAAVTLPLLFAGGQLFVQRALKQERALHWQQARNWLRARRDPLAWADNRLAFGETVQQLKRTQPGVHAGLFLLDLHDFQRINDACGHTVGDAVLRQTARRLRQVLRDYAAEHPLARTAARRWTRPRLVRVGSDEFACWLPLWQASDKAERWATRMLGCLQEPMTIGTMRLHVNGNVGHLVGGIDEPGLQLGQEWLTRVNAAVQQAKRLGAGQATAFSCEQLNAMVRRHEVHLALEAALKDGTGLRLDYQPIVSVKDRHLLGCEALMRWQHPQWGTVSPAEFIPVAEGSDLIRPLGRWVLSEGIRQLARWRADLALPGAARLRLSLNLSRAQLLDAELVGFVEAELQRHKVPPRCLCLEVTESLPLDDVACVQALQALRRLGLAVALDDFGTGYSSLSALLNLPLDSVKIDRHFISGIDTCTHRQSLVAAVVRVAQGMQLNVVAEGIEQAAEAQTLTALGCHHMQGWLISAGIDAQAFARRWLQTPLPDAPNAPTLPTARTQAPAALSRRIGSSTARLATGCGTAQARPHATPEAAAGDAERPSMTTCDLDTCPHERFGACPAVLPATQPFAPSPASTGV